MVKNKFLARLLAGLLTVSTVFISAPSYVLADGDDDELTDDLESKVEHTDKKFDELEIEDLSEDEFDSIIKDIDDLCQDEANSDEVIEIITEMEKYLSRISANGSLAYIYTTLDAEDESADEEYQKWDELYTNCADKVMITYHTVAESACSDALKEKIDDDDDWQDILDYVPMTDEQKEMQKKDTELSLKYDELADKEYTYEINGEEYDMDMLEEAYTNGDISFDEYLDALADIMTRQNEEKGELYIELVELRTEFAKSYGYDNYADYCYDKVYDRDYTHDDLKAFDDQVKEYYSPLLSDLYNEFSDRRDEFDALSDQDMSYDECCRLLSEHFSDISDDLYESYNYMVDHDLCNMEIDDKKAEGGYTTDIAGIYNSVYIFNDADGSVQDLATLIHEFGHYNQKYFASEEEWEYGLSNLDLAEIHSQGLEAIYDKYADELYGDSADIMRIYNALNQVYGAVEGCKEDEFQYRIYSDPYDLTVSKINQVYYECCEEYGDLYLTNTYYLALYGKTPSCEIYEWADIHHTFKSPCYYISYAVSMGAVDELKNVLEEDRDEGIKIYLELVNIGCNGDFQETVEKVGLNNPLTNPRLDLCAYNIRTKLGMDTSMLDVSKYFDNTDPDPTETSTSEEPDDTGSNRKSSHTRDDKKDGLGIWEICLIAVAGVTAVAFVILVIGLAKSGKKKDKNAVPGPIPGQNMQAGQDTNQPGQGPDNNLNN